jgi:MFS family permease
MLRDRALRALLVAELVSTTGSQMTWLALPWFVLSTTGSASRMSIVLAAEVAAYAIFGLPAGALVARLGARRSMLLADGLRAPLMLLVPLLHWGGLLSYPTLVVFAFAIGALATPYGPAQRVIVPELLGEDDSLVTRANALFQTANRSTTLLGPPIAGALIGLIGATAVLVIDASTFCISFAAVALFVPAAERAAAAEQDHGVLAGLAFVRRDQVLRVWAGALTLGDAAWQVVFAGTPVLVFTHYGGHAVLAGLILGGFGLGAVLGNLIAYRVFAGGVPSSLVSASLMVQALPVALLALPVPGAVLVAAMVVSGMGNGVANPTIHATLTLRPPLRVRPQVISALFVASAIGAPVALVVAAPAFARYGSRPVMAAAAVAQILAMIVLAHSIRRHGRGLADRP